ncbi:MAG: ABC transporter substrate-binding protein [Alphaproteobacteria bacterium]
MTTRRQLLTVFAASALAHPAIGQTRTRMRFSLNLPRNGSNLPFLFGREKGFFAEEGIDITDMDPASGADAAIRVASNAYDASFADITGMPELAQRSPDAIPLAVFNVFRTTPASVVTWARDGITKPADLVGKTLGGPITDNGFRLFPVFFKQNGLDPSTVSFVNMDLRLREQAFVRREVMGITGFDSTIWLNLKLLGVKREDISIMNYSAHGLDIYGNTVLVSRRFVRDHEAAIPGFLRAVARSWREAARDPKTASETLTRIDSLIRADIEEERFRWVLQHQVLTPETASVGLGPIDRGRMQRGLDLIGQAFGVTSRLDLDRIWTDKYMPERAARAVG